MSTLKLTPILKVIEDYRAGKMVIIADDSERENEGDLAIATEMIKDADLAFMLREARGLICVSISEQIAKNLMLPPQSHSNSSRFHTPFTVSVDHHSVVQHGISAAARVTSMRMLVNPDSRAEDFSSPGHVFPLVANPKGVLARRGQTEGSYDLARLAGLIPSGVICEILNPDGSMARAEQLNAFAVQHSLSVTTIEEIANYRIAHEVLVRQVSEAELSTDYGVFRTYVFVSDVDNKEHMALVYGQIITGSKPLVRIHSECLTGDVFGSRRCDCGMQLSEAMRKIVEHGSGVVLYLRQEGRGIGLENKIRAYALQDRGRDTVEANLELGFEVDSRDFAVAAKMLEALGLNQTDTGIRLLTNNPDKFETLKRFNVNVIERVSLTVEPDEYSIGYINTKRSKMGHLL